MTLAEYLKTRNITAAEFGRSIGREKSTVARWARGIRMPDRDDLQKIFEATGHAVSADDFAGTVRQARSAA